MGLFDPYRIKKAIAVLLSSSGSSASAQSAQAMAQVRHIGKRAIPYLIRTLGHLQIPETISDLLVSLLNNETLPLYVQGLLDDDPKVTAGVVAVLSRGRTYDPNRLLESFTEPRIGKTTLGKILACHKEVLDPKSLLDLLDTVGKDGRAAVCRLVEDVATEAMIPELIRATRSEDWMIRYHMARVLARFHTVVVRDTLLDMLQDPHKNVRRAVLEALSGLEVTPEVGPICALLRDPDLEVQSKAIETLIKIRHPRTVHHLLDLLGDEDEYVRRSVVEVLNAVGDEDAIKDLLAALKDKDWWVASRAVDALATIGGPKVIAALPILIRDDDEFIRRSAVEIINATKDEQAFDSLLGILDDEDWWVQERAIDALAALGDARAVPPLLHIIQEGEAQARVVAIRALGKLGDQRAVEPLIAQLQYEDKTVRHEAIKTLSVLADETHVDTILSAIKALSATGDTETVGLAQETAVTLAEKFGVRTEVTIRSGGGTDFSNVGAQSLITGVDTPLDTPVAFFDANTLKPDDILADRYRIIRHIGRGGFGTVFLVEDMPVREELILKFLNPHLAAEPQMIQRFTHELRYARRIAHANVIRIHDFQMIGKAFAISMEYFHSHSLGDELRGRKPLAFGHGIKVIWDLCNGMQAAHNVDVVHRDLKPPNILIDDNQQVKIVDFGLAAASSNHDTRLTRTGALIGTPIYMAPEQVESNKIDARTDIYSLGIIMYEMFAGRPPYVGKNSMAVLYKHVSGNAVPPRERNPRIPPQLEAMIMKAMAVNPDDRFQTMNDVRQCIMELTRQGGQ